MGDLSAHFSRSEFECHCGCGAGLTNPRLIELLESIREFVGGPVRILSGVRCRAHNKACGGVANSQHLLGNAADIQVGGVKPRKLAESIDKQFNVGGLGVYPTFVHVDVRSNKARWEG